VKIFITISDTMPYFRVSEGRPTPFNPRWVIDLTINHILTEYKRGKRKKAHRDRPMASKTPEREGKEIHLGRASPKALMHSWRMTEKRRGLGGDLRYH